MKNQYFCDVSDYTKYAILRRLSDIPKSIYWMLTSNDNGPDGRRLGYLKKPKETRWLDPELWDKLNVCVQNDQRDLKIIESYIPNLKHSERRVIDNWQERVSISNDFIDKIEPEQLVFLDPDNGYEVPSCPKGQNESCKYVYHSEIKKLIDNSCIVMLFQHKRMGQGVDDMIAEFSDKWKGSHQFSIITSYVVYYFLANCDISWMKEKILPIQNSKPHTRIEIRII
ncbi:MAG: hypothetical protein JNL74_02570 [Fibrobacteres bacterium]|nr:hypothetical protein [Fibrobacterota bacterium]